jgi:hypothetical protein
MMDLSDHWESDFEEIDDVLDETTVLQEEMMDVEDDDFHENFQEVKHSLSEL